MDQKYSLYLNELLQASCLSPFGPAELFKFAPDELVSENLAVNLDRSPFHLCLAFLPGWLIQGCSSVSNPFIGVKIHRIFTLIRFTHSYCYESACDRTTLFAIFPLTFVPFMQYTG